ncbi:MAG: hypothetical protein EFT35_00910 [Methanophagales archaeon ANME-1-THS]|nr:MAG: hypothetical protein EFT35_00910 [Methanophagales archaeon ANME-1-THS]
MTRRAKNFTRAEAAQAEMIGVVLIMGILLSVSSIYLASQIPAWTKDNEAQHTAAVADDFSKLKVLIDGLKGEEFERTATITMAPDKASILTGSSPGANLLFDPGAEQLEVIVPVVGSGSAGGNWTIPNASLTFTEYCDQNNSKRVDTSFGMVRLAAPTAANLILDNTQMELSGGLISPYVYYYTEVTLTNNSVLYVKPNTGVLKIFATSITIDASSKIDANGSGSPGGLKGAAGFGTGRGYPPTAGYYYGNGGGGGGYGGGGGIGGCPSYGGLGGATYDNKQDRTLYMGSGGAGGIYTDLPEYGTAGAGGAGGGAVWLDAETITIAGAIFVNGADGAAGSGDAGGGGGGSGGGILISGRHVTITGKLSANGGKGGQGVGSSGDGGGGGGGGRIKVFYDQLTSNKDWSANSGAGGAGGCTGNTGSDGTIWDSKDDYTPPSGGLYYKSGYFVSTVYNTGNESVSYGELIWDTVLSGQTIGLKVRTDWNQSMVHATPWEACPALTSKDGTNKIDVRGVSSVSPVGHQYIQFRADLSTVDDAFTPALTKFKVNYSFAPQSPTLATASGSIKFSSNYLYYPNQKLVYEHGSVIKFQKEGGFMLQEPPIIITNASGKSALKISLINLTGSNYSSSGASTASVASTFKSYNLLAGSLQYPNLTLALTTEYPQVWSTWFTRKFQDAGLDASFYSINSTGNTVKVDLKKGVILYLEKTEVEVKLQV